MDWRENSGSSEKGDDEESHDGNHRTRTRVPQQIEALQSLIPNSTGMDERSILEETLDYLLRIHRETEEIEKELHEPSSLRRQRGEEEDASQGPHILQVETEELMERRFVVKMEWRRREGMEGHVQRVMEGLVHVNMVSIVVNQRNHQIMSSIAFVEVKEETTNMTEEELQELIIRAARRSGLLP